MTTGNDERPQGTPRWMIAVAALLFVVSGALFLGLRHLRSGGASGAAGRTVSVRVETAIDEARELAAAEDFDGAEALLVKAIGATTGSTDDDDRDLAFIGVELAAIRLAAGAAPADAMTGNEIGTLANVWIPAPRRVDIYGFDGAVSAVIARRPPGLGDPTHRMHRLARAHLAIPIRQFAQSFPIIAEALLRDSQDALRSTPALLVAVAQSGHMSAFHNAGRQSFHRQLPQHDLPDVLAAAAEDPRRDPLVRRACERWLGELADVPIGLTQRSRERDLLRNAFPEGAIIAAWRRLRDLSPLDALRARLELARAEFEHAAQEIHRSTTADEHARLAPRTELRALRSWAQRHTDASDRQSQRMSADELSSWLKRDADLAASYERALGVGREFRAVVDAMEDDRDRRALGHRLLDLIVDPAVERPLWLASDINGFGVGLDWRRVLEVPPERRDVRIAHLTFVEGRWELSGDDATGGTLVEGEEWSEFPHTQSRAGVPGTEVALRVPGVHYGVAGDAAYVENLKLWLFRESDGLVLWGKAKRSLTGSGGGSSVERTGGPSDGVNVTYAHSPTINLGSSRRPDRTRNHMTLVRPMPEDEPYDGSSWTLDDWRAALVRDLERMATDAEEAEPWSEAHNGAQHALQNLCMVATWMPVPEALPALRRLLVQSERWNAEWSEDHVLIAALAAGATELIDDVRLQTIAATMPTAGAPTVRLRALVGDNQNRLRAYVGDDQKIWSRIYAQAANDEIRAFAASVIASGGLSPGLASDLDAAIRAGVVPSCPEVASVLVGHQTASFSLREAVATEPLLMTSVGCAYVVLLLLFASLIVGARRGARRPLQAAFLVVTGLAVSACSVRMAGVELLPPGLALLVAAAGAWRLGVLSASRAAYVAAVAFGVAAVASLVLAPIQGPATAVAVVALFVLGRDLAAALPTETSLLPRRPAPGVPRRAFALALLVATIGAALLGSVASGTSALFSASVFAAVAFVGWSLGVLAPKLLGLAPRSVPRALPPLFVCAYVIPIIYLLAYDTLGLGDVAAQGVGQDLVRWALAATTLAIGWCALRLLDFARAFGASDVARRARRAR